MKKRGLMIVVGIFAVLISLSLISFVSAEIIERGANWNKIQNIDGSYSLKIYNTIINYNNGTEYVPISYGSCGSNCFRDWNGFIYRVSNDERKAYVNLYDVDDNYISSFGFGIRGNVSGEDYRYTTLNFSWIWSQDYNVTTNEYIFRAYNNVTNFNWTQEFHFYPNQSMKIKNTIRNNYALINNAKFWYIQTVGEEDGVWFNGTRYTEDTYKRGEFDSLLSQIKFEDYYIFDYDDLLENGFNITDFYLGDGSIIGVNGVRILAIGITKGSGNFPKGYNVTLDPTIKLTGNGGGDAYVRGDKPTTNYGSDTSLRVDGNSPERSYLGFNISSIPDNQKIDNATLCLYLYKDEGNQNISAYHVYTDWQENVITWGTQPCGTNFDNSTNCNLTAESNLSNNGNQDNTWQCWDVKNMVGKEYKNNSKKVSIALHTIDIGNADEFYSKEYTNSSLWPYLNITYSLADIIAPSFSNYTENPANGSSYVQGQIYLFNITINETNLNTVGIEFNGINYTGSYISNISNVFSFNRTDLAAGTYSYRWWANDTIGNLNNSGIRYYIINKASQSITSLLNGVSSNLIINYPQQVNASYSGVNYTAVTIKLNSTQINIAQNYTFAAGNYFLNYSVAENQNYTSYETYLNLTINKATPTLTFLANGGTSNLTLIYSQQVNITATTDFGIIGLDKDGINYLVNNGLNVTLGAGSYIFRANVTGNQNYSDINYKYYNITINKASQTATLNINESSPIIYGKDINVSCNGELFRNNINVTNEKGLSVLLGAGSYNYSCKLYENQNYSYDDDNQTFVVNKAEGQVSLLLNSVAGNLTIEYPQESNITASTLYGILTIYENGTDITSENGLSLLRDEGYYNITAFSSGNQNYSSASITYWLNVTRDRVSPVINIILPEAKIYGYNTSLPINFSVSDEHLQACWYNLDNSANITLENCQNSSFNASDGDHVLYLYSNDSLGNVGMANRSFSVITTAPAINLIYPKTIWLNYSNNIYLNYSAFSGIGVSSCELWGNWTGTWHKNLTNNNPTTGNNFFIINLSDGYYPWQVICNDSQNRFGYSENSSFGVDTILPQILVSEPTGTKTSRTVSASWSVFDINLQSCWYNVYRGASPEITNMIMNCSLNSISFDVSSDGSFVFNFYANDSAGNLNSTSSSFSVDTSTPVSPPPGGGGGGGGSLSNITLKKEYKLEIIKISNLIVNPGESKKMVLSVKNIGKNFLNDCKLVGKGETGKWIVSSGTKGLSSGEKQDFIFTLNIPETLKVGKYIIELSLICHEYNESTSFTAEILEKKLGVDLTNVERTSKNKLRVIYSLAELSNINQDVKVEIILFGYNNERLAELTENKNLEASETQEIDAVLDISESLEGSYNLLINAISETSSTFVQEEIVLGSSKVGGFAIFGVRGETVFSIVLVALFIIFSIFILRRIFKFRKLKKHIDFKDNGSKKGVMMIDSGVVEKLKKQLEGQNHKGKWIHIKK